MKILSNSKLAETIKSKCTEKGLSKENLSELTGINISILDRIEKQNFIPSIHQFESLSNALEFEMSDMFSETPKKSYLDHIDLQRLSKSEKEGFDKLIKMMIILRKQLLLRRKFETSK